MNKDKYDFLLSSSVICKKAKITYRQMYFWVERGYIKPAVYAEGSGTSMKWFQYQLGEIIQVREQIKPWNNRNSS